MPVCYLKQKHMINKQLITRRFSRAVESYNREAVAQKQIAYRMSDMLNHYLPRPVSYTHLTLPTKLEV